MGSYYAIDTFDIDIRQEVESIIITNSYIDSRVTYDIPQIKSPIENDISLTFFQTNCINPIFTINKIIIRKDMNKIFLILFFADKFVLALCLLAFVLPFIAAKTVEYIIAGFNESKR